LWLISALEIDMPYPVLSTEYPVLHRDAAFETEADGATSADQKADATLDAVFALLGAES
jgi:hypothetical protein